MAIFTPESKFMKMMKTTLNTNRYFEENKMKINEIQNEFNDNTEDSVESSNTATININDIQQPVIKYTWEVLCENIQEEIQSLKIYNEQQIKVNKQTKNNIDRFNKKINHNTENIINELSNIESNLTIQISNTNSYLDNRIKNIIDLIESDYININNYLNKIFILLSVGIISNIILFVHLISILK